MRHFNHHHSAWMITLRGTILTLSFCFAIAATAQDVGQIAGQGRNIGRTPLQITGGLNLANNFYVSDGINARRDALQWRVLANLNLSFAGITAPFSLAFSDANRQFNLPAYTFTGISPTYKWARLHLGDRSLNFSKYTLNSINFRGAGFELEPGRLYFAGMYGQLRRAVAEDFQSQQMLEPAYRRTGYGLKTGLTGDGYEYNIMVFGAWDDPNSIEQPLNRVVLPANNAVASINGKQQLGKRFGLDMELARSAFNQDRRLEPLIGDERNAANTLLGLLQPTVSLMTGNAGRAKLSYQTRGLGLNAGYERIDRGFRTMGALFFLSDVEYYTLGFNKSLLKNKLNMFANGGIERTNLDDFERNGTKRFVGSLNANYAPSERWNFNTSFSNFQNTSKLRTLFDPASPVDSIILAQTTQTVNGAVTYNLPNKDNPSSISLILTQQRANSIIDDVVQTDSESQFFNGSLLYSMSRPARDLRFNASINANRTQVATFDNFVLSPTLSVTKGYFNKKLQLNARTSYNLVFDSDGNDTGILNFGLGSSLRVNKLHTLSFNTNVINRGSSAAVSGFTEWYGQLMYNYNFTRNLKLLRPAAPAGGNQ
jgi:hypothetical protein